MAKSEKSKAELYREERKKRIASAAKKNAKRSRKNPAAARVTGRVIGIVLAVAVAGLAVFGILNAVGMVARVQTALTIGSHRISVAEYGYMYYMQYNNMVNQVQQAEQQYGYNPYGFDYTKSPEEQDSPYKDDDGNALKWSEQLKKNTVDYLQEFYTMYDVAVSKDYNYTVTDEEKANIDEQIESLRQTAASAGNAGENVVAMSLNAYLKASYGPGISERFLRGFMEKEAIVQRFAETKEQSFKDKYTDEEVDKIYAENKNDYDVIDLRWYSFTPETLTAEEGENEEALQKRQEAENKEALKKAEDLLKKSSNEKAFADTVSALITEQEAADAAAQTAEDEKTEDAAEEAETADDAAEAADETAEDAQEAEAEEEVDHDADSKHYATTYSTLSSSISEDAATWAFDEARKAGEKKTFTNASGTAFAVYVVKAAYPQPTVDVRHILFATVDLESDDRAPLSDDEIAEKKAQAEQVLKEWNALENKTAEEFGKLAEQYTEDTGSKENGGLYENVTPGQMVDTFDAWIFDESRKEGDVDIVESEFGYHVMYFVGNKGFAYRESIRTQNTQNDYSSWLEGELAKDSAKVTEKPSGMEKAYKVAKERVDASVAYLQQNASSDSSSYSY